MKRVKKDRNTTKRDTAQEAIESYLKKILKKAAG